MDYVNVDDDILELFIYLLMCYFCYYTADTLPINRRWWVRPLFQERSKKGAFVNIFQHMKTQDHEMFFKYTRMYPAQFDNILSKLKPKLLKRSRREYLSPELRLAMTIKYLAHGGSFQNLSWEFRVGHSTVSKIILETCEAIREVFQPIHLKTPSKNDWTAIATQFYNRWNFPNTLGAIDGKHVNIQCPINSGSQYFNYKHHFSMVLLACCDADYKFIWVDIGAYGSEHDAGVFRRSTIGQDLENGRVDLPRAQKLPGSDIVMPFFFVGDEAFPLKSYIMRPFPGKHLEEKKLIFNYRLSRARRIIENSFGIMASRWRVYRSPLLCSIKTTEAIVKATICLHNFLRSETPNTYVTSTLVDNATENDDNGNMINGEWREITRNDTNLTPMGRMGSNIAPRHINKMRDTLADYLQSDTGAVPWQLGYVRRGRI